MQPGSRRALLKRLTAAAPQSGVPTWTVLAVVVLFAFVIFRFFGGADPPPSVKAPEVQSVPLLDPVLALPFGEGKPNVAPPAVPVTDSHRLEELRALYRNADDRQAFYRQWRERPESDARYLAFRAARDCELVRVGGVVAQLETNGDRRGERERQMTIATTRCRGFLSDPAPPDELERLEQDAAAAGHPAAQIALATENFAQRPRAETLAVLRRGLASADPMAFDEARLLLAMTRHQLEIGGAAPSATDTRDTDARVVAIDLVGCRLGNPCGSSRGPMAIECGANALCQRDAEEWVLQSAELSDEERRTALALADRMLGAFKRGAVDEIVRVPSGVVPTR